MTNRLFDDKPHYSVDTSALIDCWETYPQSAYPKILPFLVSLIKDGRLQASQQVRLEVKGDDTDTSKLANWCKENSDLFVPDDEHVQRAVTRLMSKYQNPKKRKGIDNADPFVIAQAAEGGAHWCVVSSEKPELGSADKNPNIPFVCIEEGMTHMNLLEFLRGEGLSISD